MAPGATLLPKTSNSTVFFIYVGEFLMKTVMKCLFSLVRNLFCNAPLKNVNKSKKVSENLTRIERTQIIYKKVT